MNSEKIWRILVVDDEHLIRQGIKHFLSWEQEGFQIVGEASNGIEALQLIEETKPHIILTDIMMPIMDGEELTRIVKEKYSHIKVIILSSFGDFDYVRSTFQSGVVDYILKPKLDATILLNVLNKAINKVVENNIVTSFKILETVDENKNELNANRDNIYLLGIDLHNYKNISAQNVQKEIEEKLLSNEDRLKFNFNLTKKNVNVYTVELEENNCEVLEQISNDLLNKFKDLSIFISDQILEFEDIELRSFEVIKKMNKCRFYLPKMKFIKENYQLIDESEIEEFSTDQFMENFNMKEYHSAFLYLEAYSDRLTNAKVKNISDYKFFYENIIFTISVLISNLDIDTITIEEEKLDIFSKISEATCANDVQSCLLGYLEKVRGIVIPEIQQEDTVIQQILLYIENNFHEQLNLKSVSKEFHFNPSYLSNYFATNYKEGFNEYLNKIRIGEATKLLKQSKIPISEISERVGYSDHSYFCKVFKKQKGTSPSSFRRNNKVK